MNYYFLWLLLLCPLSFANQLTMKVIDIGAGLCTITKMPNGKFIAFDVGGNCKSEIKKVIKNSPIDLLIVSHADQDHFKSAVDLIKDKSVKINMIIHTGYKRLAKIDSYDEFIHYVNKGKVGKWFTVIDLSEARETYRNSFQYGKSNIQIVSGYGHNHYNFLGVSNDSKARNSISIAARFSYDNKHILIMGDAMGRDSKKDIGCLFAEKEMVINKDIYPIKSDVLIAGHHGANDTTSNCFLGVVKPEFVIYPSGSSHGHPRYKNYLRVKMSGVSDKNIFRTDRGNASQHKKEWKDDIPDTCQDVNYDDSIIVSLSQGIEPRVKYEKNNVCKY